MPTDPELAKVPLDALRQEVLSRPLPHHVGVIMDGNGRWAEHEGRERLYGHFKGSRRVTELARLASELGIEALTLYAFSTQNWARPGDEVHGLMDLLCDFLLSERPTLHELDIKLNAIGDLDQLPERPRALLAQMREETAAHRGLTLTLALSYGGREEILRAARALATEAAAGRLDPAQIDAKTFEAQLWTAGLPPLDLVVRTSGEVRISNFLLWQIAYAEIVLTRTLWPDFDEREFLACLCEFQRRERRFGQTSAQIRRGTLDPGSR